MRSYLSGRAVAFQKVEVTLEKLPQLFKMQQQFKSGQIRTSWSDNINPKPKHSFRGRNFQESE